MPQVSVVILTYNPNPDKLRQTLRAAAEQKEVDLEIIISDDGSASKDFSFLPDEMARLGVKKYRLLEHKENRGTVCSCLSAVEAATGQYVFLTSPGDLLHDCFVLRDFYRFAEENNAPLCFGNAVSYSDQKITRKYSTPAQPCLYKPGASRFRMRSAFFGGIWVIGATYFRRRDVALSTFQKIAGVSKFMEDTPSTAYALAEGHCLTYFDRNIVFYEDGTGVSTGASNKWAVILRQDLQNVLVRLKETYPKDAYVDLMYRNLQDIGTWKRLIGKLLYHPILTAYTLLIKHLYPKKQVAITENDISRLHSMLSGNGFER